MRMIRSPHHECAQYIDRIVTVMIRIVQFRRHRNGQPTETWKGIRELEETRNLKANQEEIRKVKDKQ